MKYRLPTLAAVVVALACSPALRAEDKKSGDHPLVHTVIFTLKADAPESAADDIITDCHEMLAKIPTVKLLRAGKPVEGSTSPVSKKFTVGLTILFDDAAGLKTYTDHPLHKQFVAKNLKNIDTSKLAAFDFVDAKK